MRIDCISDLHGHYPELEGGDLLIVAGDLTERDRAFELMQFGDWLNNLPYKKKIVIGGNHDNLLAGGRWKLCTPVEYGWGFDYLCDSGTEFEELKIWGSPWTRTFFGQNPDCMAFALETEEELAEKFALIPKDIDILVTHSPPYGILDQIIDTELLTPPLVSIMGKKRVGSKALYNLLLTQHLNPKLCVFGHIHEGYGHAMTKEFQEIQFVNASHMDEVYEPINKPIRIVL